MKIGVNLWTIYGWGLDEPVSADVLRAIGCIGADSVELVVDDGHNTAEALLARREELAALLAETGLRVPGIASALFHRLNLGSQDAELRGRGLELIRNGCKVAQAYGAGVLLVVAGRQEPGTEYARTWDTAVESFRTAADYAEDAGIVIGVENVGSNFLVSPGEFARFLADVDRPRVQAYLDPGNGAGVGNGYAENWVTALRGRIALVHAKDYDRAGNQYVCCGLGDVGWDTVGAALRDVGYDGDVMIETPPKNGRGPISREAGLTAAETSLRWLRRVLP